MTLLRDEGGAREGPPPDGRGLEVVCGGRGTPGGPGRDDEAAAEAIAAAGITEVSGRESLMMGTKSGVSFVG